MPWQTEREPRHTGLNPIFRRLNMHRTLVIAGLKGGVGKTTTALSLASAWAMEGRHVLLLDLDPQASASLASGHQPAADPLSTDPVPMPIPEGHGTLELLAGGRMLALARAREVERHLARASQGRELIVIDTPPAHSPLTAAAFRAADMVLAPIECTPLSIPSLRDLSTIIEAQVEPPRLRALLVRVQRRRRLTSEVAELIAKDFPGALLDVEVPEDVRAAEAPGHGIPLCRHAPRSRAAAAYRRCAALLTQDLGGGQ